MCRQCGLPVVFVSFASRCHRISRCRNTFCAPYRRGSDGADQLLPRYQKELGLWTGPFPMAGINTRVVRRSNALFGHAYGDDFQYTEAMKAHGWLHAVLLTVQLVLIVSILRLKWLQSLLWLWIPKPGDGPSKKEIDAGYWEHCVVGVSQEEPGVVPTVVKASVGVSTLDKNRTVLNRWHFILVSKSTYFSIKPRQYQTVCLPVPVATKFYSSICTTVP